MTVVTRWATCIVQICVYEAADAAQKGVTLDPEKPHRLEYPLSADIQCLSRLQE